MNKFHHSRSVLLEPICNSPCYLISHELDLLAIRDLVRHAELPLMRDALHRVCVHRQAYVIFDTGNRPWVVGAVCENNVRKGGVFLGDIIPPAEGLEHIVEIGRKAVILLAVFDMAAIVEN